ncbi:helix-turn-helix domain-containing protein [Streptomyces sp. NPDC093223]|uniref:helix-turn-helix domain-containing protein n=1 Tax=Streptomyces sp. NPDC093223 TaxID=3366033 RepID=UPI003815AF00
MTTGRIELGASGRAVAVNVKRLRKARGWSLRALSEALTAAGRGLSQDAINKIENGAEEGTAKQIRRVDVDDLMALAVVFEVNPSALLLPFTDLPSDPAPVTGVGSVPAIAAWLWADGRGRIRYNPDRRRETQDMESVLYGRPEWLHPGSHALSADASKALGLAEGEALVLEYDEQGMPFMRKRGARRERDDG